LAPESSSWLANANGSLWTSPLPVHYSVGAVPFEGTVNPE